MSIGNLERDAFIAKAFTDYTPTYLPKRSPVDAGCALEENQILVIDIKSTLEPIFEIPEFTAGPLTHRRHPRGTTGAMILAVPDMGQRLAEPDTREFISSLRAVLGLVLGLYRARLLHDTYLVIAQRLTSLMDPREWENGGVFPDTDSFKFMLHFLAVHKDLPVPRIAVSQRGYFVISWRAARDQLVTLEFRPDGMVRWLVFAPPKSGSTTKRRASGDCAYNEIMSHIAPFGVLQWMKRAT